MASDNDPGIHSSDPSDKVALETNKGTEGIQRDLPSQGDQENSQLPSQTDLLQATTEMDNNKGRNNELNHFRDQTNLEYGENIPQSIPQNTGTPLKSAVEIAMAGNGMAEQKINEKLGIITNEKNIDTEKVPDKTKDLLNATNKILEQLKELKSKYPNDIKVQETINNIVINLGNLTTTEKQPSTNINPEPVKEIPIKNLEPKPEVNPEKDKKQRDYEKVALIAGVVAGGATGALGGVAVAPVAFAATFAAGIGNKIIGVVGERRIEKLKKDLSTIQNPEERTKIEKRINNWNKVLKGTQYAAQFIKGYGIGLAASSLISGMFFQGQGLLNRIEPSTTIPAQATSGIPENKISASGSKTLQETQIDTTHATSAQEVSRSISTSDTGLIQGNRVNLPGSSWNGNLAGNPTGTMPGGEYANINYAGGQYNMAPVQLNKDLAEAGLRVTDLTNKMGTGGVHELLNGYVENIQSGVMNPNLKDVLGSMTDVPGASDVLSMIQ